MRLLNVIVVFCLSIYLSTGTAFAEDPKKIKGPWEKFSLSFGGFLSSTNTSFRLGSDVGVDIDAEKLLNLDVTNTVYRINGVWRFSKNRRHRLDLSWFSLHRSGESTLLQDIEIPDEDGDGSTTIPLGTKVESYFDFDIYQSAYSYSFLQDDRVDIAALVGLYIMPLSFGIKTSGTIDEEGEAEFTAPLPTLGLRMDIALASKWYFRSGAQFFYLEYQEFSGNILAYQAAVEYVPWKHFGIGLGFDSFKMQAEANGEDYPGIDFVGNMEFSYVGLQFYGRIYL